MLPLLEHWSQRLWPKVELRAANSKVGILSLACLLILVWPQCACAVFDDGGDLWLRAALADSSGGSALALRADAVAIKPGLCLSWLRTAGLPELDQQQAGVGLSLTRTQFAVCVESFGWESWREQSLQLGLASRWTRSAGALYWRISCGLEQVQASELSPSRALHPALAVGSSLQGFWAQLFISTRVSPEAMRGSALAHWPTGSGWRFILSRRVGRGLRLAYARAGGLLCSEEPALALSLEGATLGGVRLLAGGGRAANRSAPQAPLAGAGTCC